MNPNICNGTATANASASAAVRSISVCTLAAATDHTSGVGADRLLRNRLLTSVHASTIDLFHKLTTQTCDKTPPGSSSSVAIRQCSKVASHGYFAATRQVVFCTSAITPRVGFMSNSRVLQRSGAAAASPSKMRNTTLDLRVTVACCPCGVLQCGCSHVSRLSQPQMSCRFVSLSVLQSADHVPAPCHAPAFLRVRTRFFFLSNPSIDVSQWVHRPNVRALSTRSTDGCQLRFAQVMSCSHECISADSVSTGNGKVTMEADCDCTNCTTRASNRASGAQSAAFPFTTTDDIIQVQER